MKVVKIYGFQTLNNYDDKMSIHLKLSKKIKKMGLHADLLNLSFKKLHAIRK